MGGFARYLCSAAVHTLRSAQCSHRHGARPNACRELPCHALQFGQYKRITGDFTGVLTGKGCAHTAGTGAPHGRHTQQGAGRPLWSGFDSSAQAAAPGAADRAANRASNCAPPRAGSSTVAPRSAQRLLATAPSCLLRTSWRTGARASRCGGHWTRIYQRI